MKNAHKKTFFGKKSQTPERSKWKPTKCFWNVQGKSGVKKCSKMCFSCKHIFFSPNHIFFAPRAKMFFCFTKKMKIKMFKNVQKCYWNVIEMLSKCYPSVHLCTFWKMKMFENVPKCYWNVIQVLSQCTFMYISVHQD